MSSHSSASLSFHVPSAYSRLRITQLSLIVYTSQENKSQHETHLHHSDKHKDFLCKGNNQPTEQTQKAL